LVFASHFDRIDAKHRADAAGKPVDGVAVIDVDGCRYPALICIGASVDGHETKPCDARLVE